MGLHLIRTAEKTNYKQHCWGTASDSEDRALPTESPALQASCQVLPSKRLIVLGMSSWHSLLELCHFTLGRTKFFASIILLTSWEVRQQRIQIMIHSVVMEPNIFISKKKMKKYLLCLALHTSWEQIKTTLRISNSALNGLYNNKQVTRRGFGHGQIKTTKL